MHSNIGACTLFAATSGASIATAATVGTVAIPQTCTGGYNERLFMGTLAAGGTLGDPHPALDQHDRPMACSPIPRCRNCIWRGSSPA